MSIEIELVRFGDAEVPFPVTLGVINEFRAAASRLQRDIDAATEFDALAKRRQLGEIERAIAQLQVRLDALDAEADRDMQADVPPGVFRGGTGWYYRTVNDVVSLVCEDCWNPVPMYRDFQNGLISPESDGDQNGNFVKRRRQSIEGSVGEWHPGKVVCLPCYRLAFRRVYPEAELPELSDVELPVPRKSVKTTLEAFDYVPEPKGPLMKSEIVRIEPQLEAV